MVEMMNPPSIALVGLSISPCSMPDGQAAKRIAMEPQGSFVNKTGAYWQVFRGFCEVPHKLFTGCQQGWRSTLSH